TARAWVQSVTDGAHTPTAWRAHFYAIEVDSLENPQVPNPRFMTAVQDSVNAWTDVLGSCSQRSVVLKGTTSGSDVKKDGTNAIIWRLPGYCRLPEHADAGPCRNPSAAATTTVFYVDKPGSEHDGEILEADMEINADSFSWDDKGNRFAIDV